jgi:tetratricopeptide (TPR) repeat protein
MRRVFLITTRSLPVVALTLTLLAQQPAATNAGASAEAAIKARIEAETQAYYDRKLDPSTAGWVHDERASRILISRQGFNQVSGWNNIVDWYKQGAAQLPNWTSAGFTNSDYRMSVKGNMAYVEYDQTSKVTIDGRENTSHSHELRTLVKEGGDWKFLSMATINTDSFDNSFAAMEQSINSIGYLMLSQGKSDQAIEVFKLNTKLYPQSANVYDSLGEAYMKAGKKDLAIQNYQRSLELNHENKNAQKMLSDLKAE